MKALAVLVVTVALAVFGMRVLVGTGQRVNCGADGGDAFLLSVQALGAPAGVLECAALLLPSVPSGAATPPAARPPATLPPPATVTPEPTMPHGEADQECQEQLGLNVEPNEPLPPDQLNAYHECMKALGHWVPVD
jgi:hypothetical protein